MDNGILSIEEYLHIIESNPENYEESLETIQDMDETETIQFLHEMVETIEPRPENDYYEIGYPAKFSKFMYTEGRQFQIKRYGLFARNSLLDDNTILAELQGETGVTGQRFKRRISIANRAQLTTAQSEISSCLSKNVVWANHFSRILSEIQSDYPTAEVDISIFNPSTGVLTIYYVATEKNCMLYIPPYSVIVYSPDAVRLYYGGITPNGQALTFQGILNKYYDGDLSKLLLTMTWGGGDERDIDIIEDLGGAYRTFRCDIHGEE